MAPLQEIPQFRRCPDPRLADHPTGAQDGIFARPLRRQSAQAGSSGQETLIGTLNTKKTWRLSVKVGDLIRNIHALYPAGMGIILEISKSKLANPNACPYRIHWYDGYEDAWMRADWLEKL